MKKFKSLTDTYEDGYLRLYSEALEDDFYPDVEEGESSISDEAIKKYIALQSTRKLTKKEEAELQRLKKEKYYKDRHITLLKGKKKHNKANDAFSKTEAEDRAEEREKGELDPMGLSPDEEEVGNPKGKYDFPPNYAHISPMDWKFPGDMGRLSHKLYASIRNGSLYPEVPRYSVTREEAENYLKLPVKQLKYVIDTALKYNLDIDDSIWDTLEVKSKKQSELMNKSAGMDRKKYYGESFVSLSETYSDMNRSMLAGLDLKLYEAIILGESLSPDMQVQYDVLSSLSNGSESVVMELINHYGGLWRNIINKVMERGGELTPEELIAQTNKLTGNDIRKVAKAIKVRLDGSDPQADR